MKKKNGILTAEERQVLVLVALSSHGKHISNDDISQHLGLPVGRVKALMHKACIKLGAHNRQEAGFLAIKRGEIVLDEFLSLDDIALMCRSLSPDTLRRVARLVRKRLKVEQVLQEQERTLQEYKELLAKHQETLSEYEHLLEKHKEILPTGPRQNSKLRKRQRDVLVLTSQGLTNNEIAERLRISTGSVRTFLNRVCGKLGARKRDDAAALALRQGELSIGDVLSFDDLVYGLAPLGSKSIEKIARLLDRQSGQEQGDPLKSK